MCRGCEVRVDCLEYALAHGEKFGIWGGLSERERRRVRRQRALERRTAPRRLSSRPPATAEPAIGRLRPPCFSTRRPSSGSRRGRPAGEVVAQRASSAAGAGLRARPMPGPRARTRERVAHLGHAFCRPVRSSAMRFIDTCARRVESSVKPERAHAGQAAVALAHRARDRRASATSSQSSSQFTATSGGRALRPPPRRASGAARRAEVGRPGA